MMARRFGERKIENKWIMNEILNFWGWNFTQFPPPLFVTMCEKIYWIFIMDLFACGEKYLLFCRCFSVYFFDGESHTFRQHVVLEWTWFCVWKNWKLFCRMDELFWVGRSMAHGGSKKSSSMLMIMKNKDEYRILCVHSSRQEFLLFYVIFSHFRRGKECK